MWPSSLFHAGDEGHFLFLRFVSSGSPVTNRTTFSSYPLGPCSRLQNRPPDTGAATFPSLQGR